MCDLEKRATLDEAAESAGVSLEVRRLDVQELAGIATVVNEIVAAEGRIDTLINNAGVGFVKTIEHAGEEEMRQVIDINQLGVMRCTKAVLPRMREQRSGHVIAVSSRAAWRAAARAARRRQCDAVTRCWPHAPVFRALRAANPHAWRAPAQWRYPWRADPCGNTPRARLTPREIEKWATR